MVPLGLGRRGTAWGERYPPGCHAGGDGKQTATQAVCVAAAVPADQTA